jgi:Bacterial Ig domain
MLHRTLAHVGVVRVSTVAVCVTTWLVARLRLRIRIAAGVIAVAGFLAIGLAAFSSTASSYAASTYQVPSSIPGDCSVDVTQPLLSWIASVPDNSTLSFGAGRCYRIEGTLEIRDRSGLDFEGNGATFRSLNPPDDQRAIWRVIDSTGFAFRNMTIEGSYGHGGTFNASLQHAHAIDLRGTGAEVAGVTMRNVAGDCVYFGLGYTQALNRSSGSVHDSTCSGTGRNAVSVTAADDVLVQHVTTSAIGYTAFDVEPNSGSGWGSRGVTFDSNTIGTYYLYAYAVVENAPISAQSFTNNRVIGGKGLRIGVVAPGASYRPQDVTITGNSADTATWSPAAEFHNVDGLTMTANTVPMSGGTMATVDYSCAVNISGNSYPGGTAEDSIAPFSCDTSPVATAAPTVKIVNPLDGATVSGRSTSISAQASSSAVKMELYIDGALGATSSTSSINMKWNLRPIASGAHQITARAYDASNQIGSSTVTVYK